MPDRRKCQMELEFRNVGFLKRREYRNTRRKTCRSKDENQQQAQPTYDAEFGNRVTLVEGECSHHCAIPAPAELAERKHEMDGKKLKNEKNIP